MEEPKIKRKLITWERKRKSSRGEVGRSVYIDLQKLNKNKTIITVQDHNH